MCVSTSPYSAFESIQHIIFHSDSLSAPISSIVDVTSLLRFGIFKPNGHVSKISGVFAVPRARKFSSVSNGTSFVWSYMKSIDYVKQIRIINGIRKADGNQSDN